MREDSPVQARTVMHNEYTFACYDSSGKLRWEEVVHNLVTNEGLDDWLDKYLKGSSYTAGWFVGLIDTTGFSALAATDVASNIDGSNGWDELTDYDETARQPLQLAAVSGQSVTTDTSSKAVFSMNAAKGVKGGFLTSVSTQGPNASTILLGAAAFTSVRSVESGDTLNVSATLSAASG